KQPLSCKRVARYFFQFFVILCFENFIDSYFLKDKSLIYPFGKRGKDLIELINPGLLMVVDNTLQVYDAGRRSLK
ncbi:MAG: hypothetical protein ACRCT5_04785, partial [Tannerellaceae bacterium]